MTVRAWTETWQPKSAPKPYKHLFLKIKRDDLKVGIGLFDPTQLEYKTWETYLSPESKKAEHYFSDHNGCVYMGIDGDRVELKVMRNDDTGGEMSVILTKALMAQSVLPALKKLYE